MKQQKILELLFVFAFLSQTTSGLAQSVGSLMREWESLPENPSMRETCSTSLRYATSLADLKNKGASVVAILRWGQQEAEKSAAEMPSMPLLPIGTQMIVTKLTQQLYTAAPIYELVKGGFPQWVYRSCLKGKPVA